MGDGKNERTCVTERERAIMCNFSAKSAVCVRHRDRKIERERERDGKC